MHDDIVRTAHLLADAARVETLRHFRQRHLATENKAESGFDPVTAGDRATEQAMRKVLQVERPQDSVFGEEFGKTDGESGITWLLDPIDGTRGYLSGTPTWGVLIAACDASGPIFGIIDQPFIGERFEGGLGRAYYVGPSGSMNLAVRTNSSLKAAILFSTFPEIGSASEATAFRRVADKVRLVRYGMDCYAYALLALGQIDLVIEAGLHRYDIAAPIAVIEAAGGVVTDWNGNPVDQGGRVIAAATPELHLAALERLAWSGEAPV